MSPFNFSIDLPARGDWENVDLLRGSVQNCFTAMFSNVDCCHALALLIERCAPSRMVWWSLTSTAALFSPTREPRRFFAFLSERSLAATFFNY